MVGKRALIVTSLGGRQHMFGPDSIHGELAGGMLRHLLQGSLAYVGYTVYAPFIAYHVPYVTDEERKAMLASLEQQLDQLESRETLKFPSLADYDAQFKPLRT